VTAAYTWLLRICCLAADVSSSFVSRTLPSNGSARYSIVGSYVSLLNAYIGFLRMEVGGTG
jgi:hypothetical protein